MTMGDHIRDHLVGDIEAIKERWPDLPISESSGYPRFQVYADLGYVLGELTRLEAAADQGMLMRVRELEQQIIAERIRAEADLATMKTRAEIAERAFRDLESSLSAWRRTAAT